MRIIDCFPYFNEKELLELRIKLLENTVDLFVICEADYTQSGIQKEYTCRETIKQLGLNSDKIRIVEVNLPNVVEEPNHWVRERNQRNAAAEFIDQDTVAIVTDCDEIMRPDLVPYYTWMAQKYPNNILRIPMAYLNCRADLHVCNEDGSPKNWSSGFICLSNQVQKYTLSEIRESHAMNRNNIEYTDIFITDNGIVTSAGWHFSWMGKVDQLKQKSLASMHVGDFVMYAAGQMGSPELFTFMDTYVAKEGSTDPLGRANHILQKYPIDQLPAKIFELPHVKDFLLPE